MKLMMVCPTCNGLGVSKEFCICGTCHGKAVVEPSAQILDDLECAEIERELLDKITKTEIVSYPKLIRTRLYDADGCFGEFYAETKLEALRKAKDWMGEVLNESI